MIFVTVGMHDQAFDRLVAAADALANRLTESVVIQYGCSNRRLAHAEGFDFVDEDELCGYLKQARVVVSHAGAGSILNALLLAKPLVVVPRLARWGEAMDDHQLELTRALAKQEKVVALNDLTADSLEVAIHQASARSLGSLAGARIRATLASWVADVARQRGG